MTDTRADRLKAALRENLKRRKAQARARSQTREKKATLPEEEEQTGSPEERS